jgi:hypothetical protein
MNTPMPIDAPQHVMEIVSFRLNPDADPTAFEAAARAIDTLLHKRGTVASRSLVVDENGLWTDIVEWTSMEEAKAAAEELVKDPLFAPLGTMIDAQSVTMRHAPIQHQME